MLGSLTVALYLVSQCVEHIMGQVLTKITPQWWSADGATQPRAHGRDECGGRLHSKSKSVHHIALHDNEEIVIRESQVVRAVNGAVVEPLVEAERVQDTGARARTKRSLDALTNLHQDQGTEASVEVAREPEPKRRLTEYFRTLIKSEYPFLEDAETVDYLRSSKTMFVMKGLPGSGKSHLAKRILQTYPGAVLCSADDFFMKDGRYEYDRDQLAAAHEACQRRAEEACRDHRAHIVIDNTNLRDWEWNKYGRLAAQHHYLLMLLEPDTAWRRDPARLALTNSHGLTETDLRQKLKSLKISVPLYYGWILNAADCQILMDRVHTILKNVFRNNKVFADDFCTITGSADITELAALYPAPAELLHCTARFCGGRARAADARQYAERPEVRRALGRLSTARVTGLLLTPRSLGARLTLDDAQLAVWAQDDLEATAVQRRAPRPACATGWQTGAAQPSLAVSGTKRPPRTAAGRRAHLTLGCRPGWPPVVTGSDLMAALDVLTARPEVMLRPAARVGRVALHRVQDQVWYMDFERDLVVDAVFGARY